MSAVNRRSRMSRIHQLGFVPLVVATEILAACGGGSESALAPTSVASINGDAMATSLSVKAAAEATDSWSKIASEGATFTVTGQETVRFGTGSHWAQKVVSGTVSCSNSVFGDPAFGLVKECDVLPSTTLAPTWALVATEGGSFTLTGQQTVRYGASGQWVQKIMAGTFSCSNAVFGDPISGTVKECALLVVPPVWTRVASEGASLTLALQRPVRYGASDHWIEKILSGAVSCSNAVFADPLVGVVKECDIQSAVDVTSADMALYSSVPWGSVPLNGFYYLNNTFGRGNFVNGVDYTTTMKTVAGQFPFGALMEWKWPDAGSGSGFAYGYPEVVYGGSPYGNPYNSIGPWPQRVVDNRAFVATYDITLGGNPNSYDVLLDIYVTATPTSTDGTHVAEISFFPHMTDPKNLTSIHQFAWGPASVIRQGQQVLIRPVDASGKPRDILRGSIDVNEVFGYLVSLGWITGNEYLRGAEFGAEMQVPNTYNSLPHQGSMLINALGYVWN